MANSSSSRSLHTGRCNWQSLTVKTSDFNTKCQCQAFWPGEGPAAESQIANEFEVVLHRGDQIDENGQQRQHQNAAKSGFCICQHHACYHEKDPDNSGGKERANANSLNSFEIAVRQSSSSATSKASSSLHRDLALSTTFDDHAPPQDGTRHHENLVPGNNDADWTRRNGTNEGLGLSISTTRDEPSDIIYTNRHGLSVTSSAATEIAPYMFPSVTPGYPPPSARNYDRQPRQYYYPNVPQFPSPRLPQHAQLQRLTPHVRQEAPYHTPSTIADSPLYSHPGIHSLSQRTMGVVGALNSISMSLLPTHLQRPPSDNMSNATSVDYPSGLVGLGDDPFIGEEITRTAMAAEGAARALLQCLQRTGSHVGGGFVTLIHGGSENNDEPERENQHMRPPTIQPTIHSPELTRASRSSSPAASNTSKKSAFSSIPPPRKEVVDNSFRSQLQTLAEKLEGLEDVMEDTANKAELAEDRVMDMEGRMVNVEDKVDGVAESFTRHKDESASRKRYHDDLEDDDASQELPRNREPISKRRRKRRRKHKASSEEAALPKLVEAVEKESSVPLVLEGTTVKTTTRTLTSFTKSTSTSFTSTSSRGSSSSEPQKTQSLLSTVLVQLSSLSARIAALEFVSPPTATRPWTVQVVVLPPTTWTTWKKKENMLRLNTQTPRVPPAGGKAWKRLYSRGLIKCIDVTGGESRDVERAIRKSFGCVFKALYEDVREPHDEDGEWEWSPLRKAPKQSTLRFLDVGEMDKGFWKSDFLRGTCAAAIATPPPSAAPSLSAVPSSDSPVPAKTFELEIVEPVRPVPTHRLWLTNCWTGGMNNVNGRDTALESTQQSSLGPSSGFARRVREASVSSTQRSFIGRSKGLKRSRLDLPQTEDESASTPASGPFVLGLHDRGNFGGGWACIRALPCRSTYTAAKDTDSGLQAKTAAESEELDMWKYDETLDGPLPDSQNPTRAYALESGDDNTSESFVRVRIPKKSSGRNKDRNHDKTKAADEIQRLGESFASQASFYGFEDTPLKASPEKPQEPGEEPSHTMERSELDTTPRPPPPINAVHPVQLRQRLENLDTQQTAYDTGYRSVSEAEEERRRGSRSPTVEDDPPASLFSYPLSSYHTGTAGYAPPSNHSGASYGGVQRYSPSEAGIDTAGWGTATAGYVPKSFLDEDE